MHIFGGTLQQQDVAVAGGEAPVAVSSNRISFTSGSTTHNVILPASIAAGDLILVIFANDGSATASATNFTLAYSEANGTATRLSVLAKVAVGTEGGTTVNFATSASETGGALSYRITGWGGTIATDIVFGTGVSATSASHNPPNLTTGWGAVPALWFVAISASGSYSLSSFPANYDFAPNSSGLAGSISGTTACLVAGAMRTLTAASEDPGNFTMGGSTAGIVNTFAIRGT